MKINLFAIVLICLSCAQPNSTQNNDNPDEDKPEPIDAKVEKPSEKEIAIHPTNEIIVYVTSSGDKYHTADCRYSKTAHEVKFSQAKADGKKACGICRPSSTTGEKQIRCATTTGEGAQCKRMTTDASGKCFQHRDS
ncbi:MAG TPA: hypothetical protein VIS49_11820 [Cyclobacteriaceae bacterium]